MSHSLKIAKLFKAGNTRKQIAVSLGVTLEKVPAAILQPQGDCCLIRQRPPLLRRPGSRGIPAVGHVATGQRRCEKCRAIIAAPRAEQSTT